MHLSIGIYRIAIRYISRSVRFRRNNHPVRAAENVDALLLEWSLAFIIAGQGAAKVGAGEPKEVARDAHAYKRQRNAGVGTGSAKAIKAPAFPSARDQRWFGLIIATTRLSRERPAAAVRGGMLCPACIALSRVVAASAGEELAALLQRLTGRQMMAGLL